MFNSVGGGGHSPTFVALAVKYIPNSPAKNISSLASHTMVPTLTMFGRFSVWIRAEIAEDPAGVVAVVTRGLWTALAYFAPAGARSAGRWSRYARRQRSLPQVTAGFRRPARRVVARSAGRIGRRPGPPWDRPDDRSPAALRS